MKKDEEERKEFERKRREQENKMHYISKVIT